ncbi:hypothetical protein SS50377_20897 [Spironucleus salmonicida]|uniref:Uncharacterized protein n=1 Tax=Spironucleus salmonicida TaxID=348837 RepID=V6LGC0_9EUKA|nr:hypothetical protein SS50377_20897 [Spironucleus salmonicida]|eukprot:EST43572.1 Hypothetical protein SS50377_16612 [Spironucleus salmonicida]
MADLALLSDSADSTQEVVINKDIIELSKLQFQVPHVSRINEQKPLEFCHLKMHDGATQSVYQQTQQELLFQYFQKMISKIQSYCSLEVKYLYIQLVDQSLVAHQIITDEDNKIHLGNAALLLLQKSAQQSQYLLYPGAVIGAIGQLIDNNNNLYLSVEKIFQPPFEQSQLEIQTNFTVGFSQIHGITQEILQTIEQIIRKGEFNYFIVIVNFTEDIYIKKQLEIFVKKVKQLAFQYKTELILLPGLNDNNLLVNPELPKQFQLITSQQYVQVGQNPFKIQICGITFLYIDYPWNQTKYTMNADQLTNTSMQSQSQVQSQLQSEIQSQVSSKLKIKVKSPIQTQESQIKSEEPLPGFQSPQSSQLSQFFDTPILSSNLPELYASGDTKRAQVYTAMMLLSNSIIPQQPSPVSTNSLINFNLDDVNVYIYGGDKIINSNLCGGALIAGLSKSTIYNCNFLKLDFQDDGVYASNFGWSD